MQLISLESKKNVRTILFFASPVIAFITIFNVYLILMEAPLGDFLSLNLIFDSIICFITAFIISIFYVPKIALKILDKWGWKDTFLSILERLFNTVIFVCIAAGLIYQASEHWAIIEGIFWILISLVWEFFGKIISLLTPTIIIGLFILIKLRGIKKELEKIRWKLSSYRGGDHYDDDEDE